MRSNDPIPPWDNDGTVAHNSREYLEHIGEIKLKVGFVFLFDVVHPTKLD